MDDRLCIAHMAIECGAKNGIFPVDETTLRYVEGRAQRPWKVYEADADAHYEEEVLIDLSALRPTIAFPHLCLLYTSRYRPAAPPASALPTCLPPSFSAQREPPQLQIEKSCSQCLATPLPPDQQQTVGIGWFYSPWKASLEF